MLMKRMIYYLLSGICLLGLLPACSDEVEQQKATLSGNQVQLVFRTAIPDPQEVNTRAIDADGWGIQSLWLFNFDADGTFIGRTQATLSGDVLDAERTFTATVSSRTRIVHLLANQNLDGIFNDNANLGVHENTVMTALTSTSGRLVYWGRVDLKEATSAEDFANRFNALTIPMFRNQAWITYTVESGVTGMEVTGSAVCNVYGNGTSIPFNSQNNSFDWPEVWTKTPYVTTPINRIKAEDLGVDTEVNKYVFETPNSGDDEIYLIYDIRKDGANEPHYYKVALIDDNKDPLPIYRNYKYTVHFTAVPEGNGSATFEDAQNAAPINNTWVSVDASIPSIGNSDVGTLTIEGETTVIYDEGGKKTLRYTYTGDKTPEVTWISNDGVTDNDDLEADFASGRGSITFTANTMTEGEVRRGVIRVKAGPLVRYITVVMVHTFTFTPVWCSYGVYNGDAGEDVGLVFTIPDTYPEDLFPVRCLITTDKLSSTGVPHLDVIYPTNGDGTPNEDYGEEVAGIGYKYVYMAEEPGTQRIYFQTNYATSETEGTIKIEAEHFETVDKTYTLTSENNGQLIIANANTYTPEGATEGTLVYYDLVPQKAGSEVTFNLRQEGRNDSQSIPAGVRVAIFTSNLKPVEDEASWYDEGESQQGSGHYYLYTTREGEDNLTFVTAKANSAETVRFSTVGQGNTVDYKSCIIELGNYREWEFNASPEIKVDYGVNELVELTFDVGAYQSDPVGGIPSESIDPGEGFYVYITTSNLIPASGETRLEETAEGYRYLVSNDDKVDGKVTLRFQTNKIVSGEKITLRSDETIAFADDEVTITNNPLTGSIHYGSTNQQLPADAFVTLERNDGTRIGVVTIEGETYSIRLRGEYNFDWEENLYMRSTINNVVYTCTTTLADLQKGTIVLQ